MYNWSYNDMAESRLRLDVIVLCCANICFSGHCRNVSCCRADGVVGALEVVVHKKAQKAVVELVDKAGLTCHVWPYMPPTHHSFHVGVVVSFGRLLPESLTAAFP